MKPIKLISLVVILNLSGLVFGASGPPRAVASLLELSVCALPFQAASNHSISREEYKQALAVIDEIRAKLEGNLILTDYFEGYVERWKIALPPAIESLDIKPRAVDVTHGAKDVTVTSQVFCPVGLGQDRFENHCSVCLFSNHDATLVCGDMVRAEGNDTEGIYTATLSIPQGCLSGQYQLFIAEFKNRYGFYDYENSRKIIDNALEVKGNNVDMTPPLIKDWSVEPREVDVSHGAASVTITARVFCPAGLTHDRFERHCRAYLPSNFEETIVHGDMVRIEGDEVEGLYTALLSIPQESLSGGYRVFISDFKSLHGFYDANSRAGANDVLMVKGSDVDTAPPRVEGWDIEPREVDITDGAAVVTVTARVVCPAGLVHDRFEHHCRVYLPSNYDATIVYSDMIRTEGSDADGIYKAILSIPQGRLSGKYRVFIADFKSIHGFYDSQVSRAGADRVLNVISE